MRPTLFTLPWLNMPIRSYGLMLMIGFLGGTWWAVRRAWRTKSDPDVVINLGFVCLLASVVGARLFYVIHYWDQHFAGRGLWAIVNVTAGGLEFYGGFLGAFAAGIIYLLANRVSVRLYMDIVAPSIMFGMAMARIGCFLNGCCWGAPCTEVPWSVRFPFASPAYYRQWEHRQVAIPAELLVVNRAGQAYPAPADWLREAVRYPDHNSSELATIRDLAHRFRLTPAQLQALAAEPQNRSNQVHPAQLYSSMDGLLLAFLLNAYFYRRRRHGTVFALMLMVYPLTRIIEEAIRIDNPHDTAGLTISQFVSLVLFAGGVAFWIWLRSQPLRSPRAVPFVPTYGAQPAPAKVPNRKPARR